MGSGMCARVSEGEGSTCKPNADSNQRSKLNMYMACVRACVRVCGWVRVFVGVAAGVGVHLSISEYEYVVSCVVPQLNEGIST